MPQLIVLASVFFVFVFNCFYFDGIVLKIYATLSLLWFTMKCATCILFVYTPACTEKIRVTRELFKNYSMSARRVEFEIAGKVCRAELAITNLISKKRQWKNYFIKFFECGKNLIL